MHDYGDRLVDDAVGHGRANLRTIELARRHCVRMTFVESGGQGMVEAMTGLPINMRRIECPYARGGGMAMNLEWVAVDFYNDHCVGCEYRQPTGEIPNLATIVEERNAAAAAADVGRQIALERRRDEWQLRHERRRTLLTDADPAMHGALEDVGTLDIEPGTDFDTDVRTAALRRLAALADRAPQTFTPPVVELLLGLVEHEHVTDLLDPLRHLTRTRAHLAPGVLAAALTSLRAGSDARAAACVTELAALLPSDALDSKVLQALIIESGAPDDRIGFAPRRPNDPAPLRVAAGIAPDRVTAALLDHLPLPAESTAVVVPPGTSISWVPDHVDDFLRASAAGAVRALAATHPDVAATLIERLVRSLAVDSDDYNEDTPIHEAQQALAAMLVLDVGNVLDTLEAAGRHGASQLRERLFGVIDQAVRLVDPHDRWRKPSDPQFEDEPRRRLYDRLLTICLLRVGGDWGWDLGYRAADAANTLATGDPAWALGQLPAFLGALLTTVDQANAPTTHSLTVVNDTPAFIAGLEEMNRQSSLASTARELLDAAKAGAAADPKRVCTEIISVMADERDTERGPIVRRRLIGALGDIGRHHGHKPRVLNEILPVLHSYLVDSDAGLRAAALRGWTEIGVAHDLPSSVADLLPALTQDNMVIVIEAVLEAAQRLHWTDEERATLLLYAANICAQVPAAADNKMLTESMSALRVLTDEDDISLQGFAQQLILRRAADLDNYRLKDALRGTWDPRVQQSRPMAALRLRLARDPVINDRWNAHDDEEMCNLLDCGLALLTLPLQDLIDAAHEVGPDSPLAAAEFAEVAWRVGRSGDAAAITRAITNDAPETPAYAAIRAVTVAIAETAAVDTAVAEGEPLSQVSAPLIDAMASVDTDGEDRRSDLISQIQARIAVRSLLANEQLPAGATRPPATSPRGTDPAHERRHRAELLAEAGETLKRVSQQATSTGAYMRLVAGLCEVGAHLLRLDAAELHADATRAKASATAAHRRAELIEDEIRQRFTEDDPVAGPLLQSCSTARAVISGSAVADVLARWARLPMPLLILAGPRRESQPRSTASVDERELAEPEVAVVLVSVDEQLVTGPQVLRPDWVYELQIEVQPGEWPEWAERLDAEFIGHLTPSEVTLPTFSWMRAEAAGGDALVAAGSMVLRFGLSAGQPALPFAVRLQWRGSRDGEYVTERVEVAGHRQLRFRPFDASRDFLTDFPVFDERLLELYERLRGAGYDEEQIQAFCRLFTAVCRVGLRMTWDRRYKRGSKVTEKQFHDDLFARLLDEPELGGRLERGTPLALGYLDVRHDRITAELKVERNTPVTKERAPKYMGQPTQYAAADGARLSILCVLDLSPKDAPIGTPENYVFTLEPALHGLENPEAPSLVATIIVNGNLPAPSSWSRRKTRVR